MECGKKTLSQADIIFYHRQVLRIRAFFGPAANLSGYCQENDYFNFAVGARCASLPSTVRTDNTSSERY